MPSRATDPQENQRRKRSRSPGQLLKAGGKSIRGLLKGKSKKKKQETKAVSSAPDLDEATIFNVEIDASEKVTSDTEKKLFAVIDAVTKDKVKETPIQIVLLLMDASSRRFELIQLTFDASSAKVNDILKQIPLSATEIALRSQEYNSVCMTDGKVMSDDVSLIAYMDQLKSNQNILLAIPAGMESSECMRLSKPILNDPKVLAMLNGVESPEPKSPPEEEAVEDEPKPVVEEKNQDSKEEIMEKEPERTLEAMEVPVKEVPEMTSSNDGQGSLLLLFVFLWILTPILIAVNARITTPLSPGDSLPAGQYRSTCGLLSIIPQEYTGCVDKVLEMKDDGSLTLTEFDGEIETLIWELKGSCPSDTECVATFEEDTSFTIGGKLVTKKKVDVTLTPFPFTTQPIKTKRKK